MNSLLNMFGGNNIMFQAFKAMMSGQNPKQFLSELAKTQPQLQGIDLSNLEQTAKQLCAKKNVNMDEMKTKLEEFANSNKTT